jgi:hypothetical protein
MTNDKLQNSNKSLNDRSRSKCRSFLFGSGVLCIHLILVIGMLLFGPMSPVSAVTINVLMDGANQAVKDQTGVKLPTGEAIQILYASEEVIHAPSQGGGPTGGDSIIWTGSIGQGGIGSGAFIRDFAGSQSLTDNSRIYVRAWNGPNIESSNYYGDSQLSATLDAGEPPMPLEWDVPSFETSNIFTPEAQSLVMSIISVTVNGVLFRSGDIISSNISLEAVISSEVGVGVSSALLSVDNIPLYPPLSLVSGTPVYGTWQGNFRVPPTSHQKRLLAFHLQNVINDIRDVTMEARIMNGAVQVVGGIFNYPNPFSPLSGAQTTIQYTLSRDSAVTIVIYDITGHETKRMRFNSGANGGRGGTNQISWDGRTLGGEVAGNGMFIYKIISGDSVIGNGKLVVLD